MTSEICFTLVVMVFLLIWILTLLVDIGIYEVRGRPCVFRRIERGVKNNKRKRKDYFSVWVHEAETYCTADRKILSASLLFFFF